LESLRLFINLILPATLWPWSRFSLWQKLVPGIFPGELRRPVRRDDNVTTFMCRLSWNLGPSTCWKPPNLFRPVQGLWRQLSTGMCRSVCRLVEI